MLPILLAGNPASRQTDASYASTVALLTGDGANDSTTITDSSALASNWTAAGACKLSTAQRRFGFASMVFTGAIGTYAEPTADSSNFAFGTGDFTVEMWLYPTTITGATRMFYDARPAGTQGAYTTMYLSSTGVLTYYASSNVRITGDTLSINTWYHVALCKSSGSTRLFVNGVQSGTTYTDATSYAATSSRPRLGANGNAESATNFIGNIDDVRITKGVARYTTTFTPPIFALPTRL
jgi:hypothetical protein